MRFLLLLFLAFYPVGVVQAADYKPNSLDLTYNHDRFVTLPRDEVRTFRAYITSFDSDDDDTADGKPDFRAVPEWVAYEVRAIRRRAGKGPARPSTWITDAQLRSKRIAPDDDSYKHSGYSRGHMCMKQIAFRMGAEADWNTHTLLNACPQIQDFNEGIWYDLEKKTMEWADRYGKIWVICGPIFERNRPQKWIGDRGEVPVAIPDAFFKIVIRESGGSQKVEVLAFVYPHKDIKKVKGKYNHLGYLISVDSIEAATGLDFLSALSNSIEPVLERQVANSLW